MPDEEEDDDTFGDFEFVPSSSAAAAVAFPSFPAVSERQTASAEDDEWGDFVDGTLEFYRPSDDLFASQNPPLSSSNVHFSDPFGSLQDALPEPHSSPLKSEAKQWERPKGALPLSIFGDEENPEEEETDTASVMFTGADVSPAKKIVENGSNSAKWMTNTSMTDLIANLYGSAEQIRTENAIESDLITNDDDCDENGWEFKDALSEMSGANGDSPEEQKISEASGLTGVPFPGSGNQEDIKVEKRAAGSLSAENGDVGEDFWGVFGGSEGFKANHIEAQHGRKSDSFVENGSFRDESWKFSNALAELGAESVNFGTEQKSLEVSSFDEVASSDSRMQNTEKGEDPPKIAVSSFFNGTPYFDNLFDVQHDFVPKPLIDESNGMNGFKVKVDAGLNDLISNFYAPEEPISVANLEKKTAEIGVKLLQSGLDNNLVNGDSDWDETDWEFKDASSETKVEDKIVGSWINVSQDSTPNVKIQKFVEFYSKLKEESHALALYHLEGLKKLKVAAALSGEDEKVMVLNEEIQSAYANLREETVASKKVHPEDYPPKVGHDRELLQTLQDPDFGVFDLEYHLSSQLSLAQKDLNAAVWLFKHASLVNHILSMASVEEQTAYISIWSKMIAVCAEELQHGSMIWKQSLQKKVHRELLLKSQALQYFAALGEIYRVAEIIRASSTLYRPWILLNSGQTTNIQNVLNDCTTIWSEAGIKEILKGMSDSFSLEYDGSIKLLLESIDSISDLDADALWSSSWQGYPVCRISLLSSGLMQDIKTVLWNGEHFIATLANLWANKISCDPPQLPFIHVR